MNILLRILFIFLGLFIFHGTNVDAVPSMENVPINYIQNDYQNVVLTFQNFNNDKIIQSQKGEATNFTFDKNSASLENFKYLLLNSPVLILANVDYFIFPRDLNADISIRAP